jgi:hypothetical protein
MCRCVVKGQHSAQRRCQVNGGNEQAAWVSPAALARQMTLHVHHGAGATTPTLSYPRGQGFTQSMSLPAVWCPTLGGPSLAQDGGHTLGRAAAQDISGVALGSGAASVPGKCHEQHIAGAGILSDGRVAHATSGHALAPPSAANTTDAGMLCAEGTHDTMATESSWADDAAASRALAMEHAAAAAVVPARVDPISFQDSPGLSDAEQRVGARSLAGPAALTEFSTRHAHHLPEHMSATLEDRQRWPMLVALSAPAEASRIDAIQPALMARWRWDLVYAVPQLEESQSGALRQILGMLRRLNFLLC